MSSHYLRTVLLSFLTAVLFGASAALAQSTNQDYPTPVTASEISGTINSRDVGDSRLTTYYYLLEAGQGDLFINIVTRNLTGDIDLFTFGTLRPLTKIVVYADLAESETGRVIYLRKPERMILRVQGRTPGDDAATFKIKFAGSFVASTQPEADAGPELPNLTAKNDSGIRVNSVGTIVEVIPKATPTPSPAAEIIAEREEAGKVEPEEKEKKEQTEVVEKAETEAPKKVEVVVTDNSPPATDSAKTPTRPARRSGRTRRTPPKTQPSETAKEVPPKAEAKTTPPAENARRKPPPKTPEPKPDPLAGINLIILFKDGKTIQRPLTEVLRFTVDRGVLTVIAKDGSIGRYQMVEVAKVTIE